jgi:hypothetical protein
MQVMKVPKWEPEIPVVKKEDAERRARRCLFMGFIWGWFTILVVPLLVWISEL